MRETPLTRHKRHSLRNFWVLAAPGVRIIHAGRSVDIHWNQAGQLQVRQARLDSWELTRLLTPRGKEAGGSEPQAPGQLPGETISYDLLHRWCGLGKEARRADQQAGRPLSQARIHGDRLQLWSQGEPGALEFTCGAHDVLNWGELPPARHVCAPAGHWPLREAGQDPGRERAQQRQLMALQASARSRAMVTSMLQSLDLRRQRQHETWIALRGL